ncbi:porin family protein [Parabacteroides pacaensis]|uniref:porin family protein n=1 Tax=Parabacteroides pacaensis TaxID=2086575 RepID=UPI000D0F0B07|nr:porin family protein [Parabacteroides pacaensis]
MKDTERDKFDNLFRNKLQDFEALPAEEDWEMIAHRLPKGKSVSFIRALKYVAAAAVVSFIAVTATLLLTKESPESDNLARRLPEIQEEIKESEKELKQNIQETLPESLKRDSHSSSIQATVSQANHIVASAKVKRSVIRQGNVTNQQIEEKMPNVEDDSSHVTSSNGVEESMDASAVSDNTPVVTKSTTRSTSVSSTSKEIPSRKRSKKWNFGMGGGGFTAGTSNSGSVFASGLRSPYMQNGIAMMNVMNMAKDEVKTNVKHHTPVSFGFSVSKPLNDRFALQSGIVYTYLSSEWTTTGGYETEVKQKLHYLGIPISLVYKIAEWNKFVFYASAGGMGEINVAGKERAKTSSSLVKDKESSVKVRMKEPLWSVNANVGATYPLVRFISVFAEAGISYYFDNGSFMETIRSEKPFNANFQLGFRFGF